MPVTDSVVVALADDLDDSRLQFADVIVLRRQPTLSSAARLITETLRRLPGCELVGASVAAGGCVLCARDSDWLVVRVGNYPISAVIRLGIRYHLVVTGAITDRRERPAGLSGHRREDSRAPRTDPWRR
ncbi:MAG: hypothetical protein M3422_23780 [Actinomycetota bacterium]|nr:hypothetical protein [Actinomycetota bacterium]